MTKLALAIFMLAACSSLDPLERNICGNGIVEPGEDCDSSAATCVACAVTCSAAADCPNSAYTCGVDGLCHAPSGVLAPASAPSLFLVDDIRITDVDHDGIGDVLGASKTSLAVRFGDKQGALTGAFTTETPPQLGPTAFGDLDADGTDDAALVTPDGIVAYASPFGVPTPATAFLPLQVNAQDLPIRTTFALNGVAVGAIVSDPTSHILYTMVVEFTKSGVTAQPFPLCNMPDADFTPDALDVYQATVGGDGSLDVVMSAWTKGTSGRHFCVTSMHLDAAAGDLSRAAHFTDLTPAGAVPTKKPIWANLDTGSAPCPWLINSDGGGPALKAWIGAMGAGHCVIAASATALPVAPDAGATASAVGHFPLEPGFPFLGQDVLVLSSTVYVYSSFGTPSFTEVYRTERVLSKVVSGDLDGDGAIDGVLAGKDDDDLEIVYRAGGGLVPGYIILRYDTAGVVDDLRVDDYDGNGIADIAYVENLLGHQALSVAYANPGHAFTTVPTASFATVKSMIPLQVQDSSDPYGAIADLLVLEDLGTNQPAFTLLHGTPQHAMLSFFDPRGDSDNNRGSMRLVVSGDFASTAGATQYRDLLAFLPSSVSTGVQVYRLDGTSAGLDPSDPLNAVGGAASVGGELLTGIDDCTAGVEIAMPCVRNAHLTAWSNAPQHDIVLGIDRQATPHAFSIDPWSLTSGATAAVTSLPALVTDVPQGAFVHSTRALDLDGDGANELVVTFQPSEIASASGAGLVEICAMSSAGMPTGCTNVLAAIQAVEPKVSSCVDAAVGHFTRADAFSTPATSAELVVLCHDSGSEGTLARVRWNEDTSAYEATVIASKIGPLRQLEIGDINGDGVDDVIAIRGDAGARSLTVLAQCESRDVTCQATGVAP